MKIKMPIESLISWLVDIGKYIYVSEITDIYFNFQIKKKSVSLQLSRWSWDKEFYTCNNSFIFKATKIFITTIYQQLFFKFVLLFWGMRKEYPNNNFGLSPKRNFLVTLGKQRWIHMFCVIQTRQLMGLSQGRVLLTLTPTYHYFFSVLLHMFFIVL